MAFASASGYNNLPNGKFSPVIYSQKVQKAFRKNSVVEDVTNTDYMGEIANYGDSVKIIKEPDITINKLERGTSVAKQDLSDADFSLIIDQAQYFMFSIDDIEANSVPVFGGVTTVIQTRFTFMNVIFSPTLKEHTTYFSSITSERIEVIRRNRISKNVHNIKHTINPDTKTIMRTLRCVSDEYDCDISSTNRFHKSRGS